LESDRRAGLDTRKLLEAKGRVRGISKDRVTTRWWTIMNNRLAAALGIPGIGAFEIS
jgi:hypothetical protein